MSEIPIQNLYYMLCYAWRYLEEGEVLPFDGEPTTKLVNLFAKVFIKNVRAMQRRGLHRSYLQFADEGRSLRGKLDAARTTKQMLLEQGRVACEFTELSTDTDINRVIRNTAQALAGTDGIEDRLARDLRTISLRMPEVRPSPLSKRSFKAIRFNRLTETYRPTIKICELIYDQLVPRDDQGHYFFREFIRDEELMRKVFEEFVRNFYDLEQSRYKVGREYPQWDAEGTEADLYRLPRMETDTSLTDGENRIVIETKYTANSLREGQYGKETLRRDHLFQIASYLQNIKCRSPGNLRGILLYPAAEKYPDFKYKIWGIPLSVKAINLSQDWDAIRGDLLSLIDAA